MNGVKVPEKPKSTKGQVSVLWDVVCNHVLHKLWLQDIKWTVILVMLSALLAKVLFS